MTLETQPYAPPDQPREALLGSAFHASMLRTAFPGRRGSSRWYRSHSLDRFHARKIAYILRQPHFASRVANYLAYRAERGRVIRSHYLPPTLAIETGARCLLRCPGCQVGVANGAGRSHEAAAITTLDTFRTIVDRTFRRCFQVAFHIHGEPLLNEDLFAACAYARTKGLWTVIHTNLMPKVQDLAERLIDCGLCNIVVAVDGATQQVYENYRRGGRLETVLRRIRAIADTKRQRRSAYPWITAKFIVFEHNWHEIALAKQRALASGADDVIFVAGFARHFGGHVGRDLEFDLDTLEWRSRAFPEKCPFIWDDLRVHADGGLFSCGGGNAARHLFDGAEGARSNMVSRYNSPRYHRMRRFFLEASDDDQPLPEPCDTCELANRFREARAAARTRAPEGAAMGEAKT